MIGGIKSGRKVIARCILFGLILLKVPSGYTSFRKPCQKGPGRFKDSPYFVITRLLKLVS